MLQLNRLWNSVRILAGAVSNRSISLIPARPGVRVARKRGPFVEAVGQNEIGPERGGFDAPRLVADLHSPAIGEQRRQFVVRVAANGIPAVLREVVDLRVPPRCQLLADHFDDPSSMTRRDRHAAPDPGQLRRERFDLHRRLRQLALQFRVYSRSSNFRSSRAGEKISPAIGAVVGGFVVFDGAGRRFHPAASSS